MRSMLLSAVVGMSALGLPLAGPSAAHADEAPATIRVTLPADATLTIDGQPTQSTSAERWFRTPALEAGKVFHYTLRATVVRGEDTVSVERRVAVRAGQESNVALTLPGATTENRAFYYDPAAPPAGNSAAYYYSPPSAPFRYPAATPSGNVGSRERTGSRTSRTHFISAVAIREREEAGGAVPRAAGPAPRSSVLRLQ